MSRYLYNAGYYWEVVVDNRNPQVGSSIYVEERSTGRRRFLRSVCNRKELEAAVFEIQRNLSLSEEEFEKRYNVQLTTPVPPPENDLVSRQS